MSLLSLQNVTKVFGGLTAVDEVSFEVEQGSIVGLIGPNGAGKTTVFNLITGNYVPDGGDIRFAGQSIKGMKPHTIVSLGIARTFQSIRLFPTLPLVENVLAGRHCRMHSGIISSMFHTPAQRREERAALERAMNELEFVGLAESYAEEAGSLSYGNQRLLEIARALASDPKLIILDEPTNHLDLDAINWLEEFLINFQNTVIVVSHDRYFLNKVCTHTADIDYGKIELFSGNYDFWYQSSQLILKQRKEANKKKEEQIKELQEFISRFSANASKSKQATSRKRALEKIQLDDIRPSSRKYPYIDFRPEREIGNDVLLVENLSKTINGEKVLDNISFIVGHDDKIAFVGGNELAKTTLFRILTGEIEPDEGFYKWGVTTSQAYFPRDSGAEFDNDYTITEWLTAYSPIKDVTYVRGFLGRMLFAGDDGVKKVKVLSGGERVRCLLSKMMISGANCLIFDEPTNHLDMESITALNEGMKKFPGVELFSCHDHQVVQTTANRIMEILPDGSLIDKITTYDDYLESDEMARKRTIYTKTLSDEEDN